VNSPGPCGAGVGGAGAGDAAAGVGVHVGGGATEGVEDQGAGSAAGLAFIELKMRVNSPGPELVAGAAGVFGGGALGAGAAAKGAFDDGALDDGDAPEDGDEFGASGEFIARNICVKLPGSPLPAAGAGGGVGGAAGTRSHGVSAGAAGKGGGVFSAEGILSIDTGLNTFANSSEGRANG
jgi:hypothetical protein